MFCPYCGAKLHEKMQYCYMCGEKVHSLPASEKKGAQPSGGAKPESSTFKSVQSRFQSRSQEPVAKVPSWSDNPVYDREAMKIYLNNVQSIESAMYKLRKKIRSIDEEIDSLALPNNYVYDNTQIYGTDKDGQTIPDVDTSHVFRAHLKTSVWIGFVCVVLAVCLAFFYVHFFDVTDTTFIYMVSIAAALFLGYVAAMVVRYKKLRKTAQKEKESFKAFRKTDRERLEFEEAEKGSLLKKKQVLVEEYKAAERLLKNLYSMDVIPFRFRNLACILYLNNRMLTSTDSLAQATVRCETEAAKWNTKKVVTKNGDAAVRNAVMMAQNAEWFQMTDQHIRRLAEEAEDLQMAQNYIKLAELNTQTHSWIQLSTFLKNI